jgi:flagellar basal-body rod protein FlgF
MENTLLVGLSRQMALSRELDVIANNVANIDTVGFKTDNAAFSEYLMPGARNGDFTGKDRRVSFVQDRATWTDLSPGALERTGNPLDVAVDGKGYLVVQTQRGLRYTRNGSFAISATGQLVTKDGDQVAATGGAITFQPGDHNISITANGIVTVSDASGTPDAPRGQLQIAGIDKPQLLQKDRGSMFIAPNGVNVGPAPQGTHVVQGALEKSNVRPVVEMARMIQITRSYSDIATVLQQQGDQRRNALQQLSQQPTSS